MFTTRHMQKTALMLQTVLRHDRLNTDEPAYIPYVAQRLGVSENFLYQIEMAAERSAQQYAKTA